jgi:hypothetical protein
MSLYILDTDTVRLLRDKNPKGGREAGKMGPGVKTGLQRKSDP